MSATTWIKFYPSDWLNGTVTLTATERGVYITLLALMYDEQGPIPDDPKLLARRCGLTPKAYAAAFQTLLEQGKVTLENSRIFNEKTRKILGEVFSRQEKARKGGYAKASRNTEENQGNDPARADDKQDPSSPQADAKHCLDPAIPDTRSQIPEKKASKLAQKGGAEEGLEAELRHAAGWHHDGGRLSHVKPIADLIAQGLSLHDDVIPTVRQLAPKAEHKTSWNFFIGPLTDILDRRKAKAPIATTTEAKPVRPSVWIWQGTPQWEAWATRGKWPTKEQRHPDGGYRPGWYFESEWPPEQKKKAAPKDRPQEAAP